MAAKRHPRRIGAWQRLAYAAEFAAAWPVYSLLRLLPLDVASDMAGRVGRAVGPRLGLSRRAAANLRLACPGLPPDRVEAVLVGMWDNLGRIAAEYIHIKDIMADPGRVEIVGGHVLEALHHAGKPALLFSGHIANWEMATVAVRRYGLDLSLVYRKFNNPIIDDRARALQRSTGAQMVPKGVKGARTLIEDLDRGRHVLMLVDQRLSRGIPVPFFGRPAMTAPAIANLAYRFDAPLVPIRVERIGGSRFRVTVESPLDLPRTGNRQADLAGAMALVNARLETWIRARPEQWLWMHSRWGKGARA